MFLDLPLSSEVWRFFLEDVNSTDTREQNCCGSILEWEWKWLEQVAALPTDNLDLTDPYAPAIHFKLQSGDYWIALHPGQEFPSQPPTVNCAYQQGFSFEWNSTGDSDEEQTTLADVVKSYGDYCGVLDATISQIKSLDGEKMALVGYSFCEDDHESLAVQIRLRVSIEETITVHVDWRNPTDFPRFISSTDEHRFANMDCEIWDTEGSLCGNLEKILEGPCEDEVISD